MPAKPPAKYKKNHPDPSKRPPVLSGPRGFSPLSAERKRAAAKEARRLRDEARREELRKQKEQDEDDLLFHNVNETESGIPIVVGEVVQVVQATPV